MNNIKINLAEIKNKIKIAADKCSRNFDDITLIAVSKRHSVNDIKQAYEAGHRDFGENYAQELRDKAKELSGLNINWHFIGHLQSNKIKYVAPYAYMMECVDSVRTAKEFSRQSHKCGKKINVLLQVNIGNEPQKHGCSVEESGDIIKSISLLGGITVKGLMAITPVSPQKEDSRKYFAALRELRDSLGGKQLLPHLSMGMSRDFDIAIEEGATIIRVGTAIFGERP